MHKNLLTITTILFFVLAGYACNKKCNASGNAACNDTVPTLEICQAVFTRWFYNASTQTCSQVSYSGCSLKGFATQAECTACKCN
jgi:hypothetical protein